MRQKRSGMWLNESESEFIDLYRRQDDAKKEDVKKQVCEIYDEKLQYVREAGREKKRRW